MTTIANSLEKTPRHANVLVLHPAILLFLFAAVCIYALLVAQNRSLWLDELLSIYFADPTQSLSSLLDTRMRRDVHPPLYYVLLHFWTAVFGDHPTAVRLMSLVPVLLGAFIIWLVWKRGLVRLPLGYFALLMITSLGLLYYSHEARAYSLLLLWGLLLTLLSVHFGQFSQSWTRGLPPRFAAALLAVSVLSALTHYFGLLYCGSVILTMTADRLRQRDTRSFILLCAIGLVTLAVGTAWILYTGPFLTDVVDEGYWIRNDIEYLWRFIREVAKDIFSGNGALFLLILWGAAAHFRSLLSRREIVLAGASVLLAITIAAAITVYEPVLVYRNMIVFAPALLFVSAVALSEALEKFHRYWKSSAIWAIFSLSLGLGVYLDLQRGQEQWRESAAYLVELCAAKQSTVLVLGPDLRQYFPYRYFLRNSSIEVVGPTSTALARARADDCPVLIWAAHYVDPKYVEPVFRELDINEGDVEIVAFEKAFLVVEKVPAN